MAETHVCIQEERLRKLENNQVAGQTEAKLYFEFISRDIAEIKEQLKSKKPDDNKLWAKVTMEALKLVGSALTIIAAIFAALKLAGV
jgi:hypothetical protein